jgi:probable rRNA maturation factor
MITVNLENRNRKVRVDLSKVKRTAAAALRHIGLGGAQVNIVFVSDRRIRTLNRKYLGIDSATDVMAFGDDRTGGGSLVGDIAISSDKAKTNARLFGTSFREELALYVIHGILHLAGYDDRTAREKRKMRKMEDEIISKTRRLWQ